MVGLITRQVDCLSHDFDLTPVTASEIEFYLIGGEGFRGVPDFWHTVTAQCAQNKIEIYKTDKENGKDQFEVALKPSDPVKTASDTALLKTIIASAARAYSVQADFSAKPFADQPGSGLHIHVHLADAQGRNIFQKNDAQMSTQLGYSIGGLLAWLNPCMIVFAPSEKSYERFTTKSNAPFTVSWGGNNRTVAIRLPDTEHHNKRIEHRVAGADAEPELVMAVILAAIHYGLKNQCEAGPQIFGDAALPMYNLPRILQTRKEAMECLAQSALLTDYFSVSDLLPNPS